MINSIHIREEKEGDIAGIRDVNCAAFETDTEANLVDALRESGTAVISLVAEEQGSIVGHILFSPVTMSGSSKLKLAGLGPMSVIPSRQRAGIGSELVEEGLRRCRASGHDAVVVLGHPDYYPRFGFVPSVRFGIRSEYDVPDDAFMVLELREGALRSAQGIACYHPAFGGT